MYRSDIGRSSANRGLDADEAWSAREIETDALAQLRVAVRESLRGPGTSDDRTPGGRCPDVKGPEPA